MSDHVLSPLEVKTLLETFSRSNWTPDTEDGSGVSKKFLWEHVVPKLMNLKLVELQDNDGNPCYRPTERGRAHIEALANLQLPVQVWVTPPPVPTAIPSGAWVTPGWPK